MSRGRILCLSNISLAHLKTRPDLQIVSHTLRTIPRIHWSSVVLRSLFFPEITIIVFRNAWHLEADLVDASKYGTSRVCRVLFKSALFRSHDVDEGTES